MFCLTLPLECLTVYGVLCVYLDPNKEEKQEEEEGETESQHRSGRLHSCTDSAHRHWMTSPRSWNIPESWCWSGAGLGFWNALRAGSKLRALRPLWDQRSDPGLSAGQT